jgi:hypothetical protein
VAHSVVNFPISSGAFLFGHTLLGGVLGVLLVARIIMGLLRVQEAAAHVQTFNKTCRTIAVLSSFVGETLTVSAGAEIEKKATGKFRFELVRLLNLAFYSYQCMLSGMKMGLPPASLRAAEGSKIETELLSAVESPTVMVCKMLANLLEQQRAAKRISNECCAVLMEKVSDLIGAYHAALGVQLSPSPTSTTSFTLFFTIAWAYTLGPIVAVVELGENVGLYPNTGLMLTVFYTFLLALFFFGLYEAGKAVEAPLKAVVLTLAVEEMCWSLSDDLASLVDDADVPVFLPRP